MPLIDIINFDPVQMRRPPRFYGFDSFLVLGKDVSLHSARAITSQRQAAVSIISSNDTEQLIRLVKKFDIVYSTIYDASPALLTRMATAKRKALMNLSDILSREGTDRIEMMHKISRFMRFCRSYRVEIVFASMANDEFGIRSPQETADVFSQLGTERKQARYCYSMINDVLRVK